MKACLLIIGASIFASTVSARAQAAAVYDAAVDATIQKSSADILAKLSEILTQAEDQNKKLKDQLDRAGDPTNLYQGSMSALKNDVLAGSELLKTKDERTAMLTNATGESVFGRATYGITPAVNENVTLKDGTVVARDAEKYEIEGKMLADVDEYRRIREEALTRKKTLSNELQTAMNELEGAQSFSAIQKYSTIIQVLQGQIASTDRAAEQALHDMEVLDREIKIQSSAARKANAEKSQLERDHNEDSRASSTLADRQTQIDAAKQSALDKANKFMQDRKGKGYLDSNTSGSPNLQWRKGTSTPADPAGSAP